MSSLTNFSEFKQWIYPGPDVRAVSSTTNTQRSHYTDFEYQFKCSQECDISAVDSGDNNNSINCYSFTDLIMHYFFNIDGLFATPKDSFKRCLMLETTVEFQNDVHSHRDDYLKIFEDYLNPVGWENKNLKYSI